MCKALVNALFIYLIFLLGSTNVYSQGRALGVIWSPPDDPQVALEQLYAYDTSGISDLEISELISPTTISLLNEFDFRIHYRLKQPYWRPKDVPSKSDTLVQQILNVQSHFEGQLQLHTINALQNGAFQDSLFWYKLKQAGFNQDDRLTDVKLILESNHPGLIDHSVFSGYRLNQVTKGNLSSSSYYGYYVYPSEWQPNLQDKLHQLWQVTSDSILASRPIFFPAEWLNTTLSQSEQYRDTFHALSQQASLHFPDIKLPAAQTQTSPNWAVLILIILWSTIALHYGFAPTYRRTISRYFLHHNFFVNDIMHRRYRAPYSAIILIVQHALSLGLICFVLHENVFSDQSTAILSHHAPWLNILGSSALSQFFSIVLVISILSFLFLSWIYISNRDLNHYSQILMLYAWPLHLNFGSVTILVTMAMAGASLFWIASWIILSFIIYLVAFFAAALDVFQYTRTYPLLYGVASIGLYLALLTVGLIWMFTRDGFWQTLDLAIAYIN